MKIIRITADNEISIHEFPTGCYGEQNRVLRELIGPACELYEHVMPARLYKDLGGSNKPTAKAGSCVSMLIDEEGLYHDLDVNYVGSFLYGTDTHGHPIVGTILIVGEQWTSDGLEFCGISEDQFDLLYPKLAELAEIAKDPILKETQEETI